MPIDRATTLRSAEKLLRQGKLEPAIQQCNLALRTDPSDQAALYHLILAMRKSDHEAEIPDLIKRLAALKRAMQEEESHKVEYRLMEQNATSATPLK